jgi:PAS domain S-box-containing protein
MRQPKKIKEELLIGLKELKVKYESQILPAQFKTYTELSPNAIYATDENGKCIYANQKWLSIAGLALEEALGDGWANGLHPDDKKYISKNWNKSVQSGGTWAYEYRFLNKEGKVTWVEGSAKALRNENNNIIGYLGTNIDITTRKIAEQKIRENEEKFKNIFNNSVVGISVTKLDRRLEANQAFCKIVGYTETEMNQMKWEDFTFPEDIEPNMKILQSIVSGKRETARWEKRYIHKKGHIIWVDISTTLQRSSLGEPEYFITTIADITKHKLAAIKLRENEEKYRLLHENAGLAIGYFKPDGTVISFNKLAAKNMGGNPEDFAGKSFYDIFPKEQAEIYSGRIQKACLSELPVDYTDKLTLAIGDVYFRSTYTKITDDRGQILGIQIISQDITEEKRAKEKAEESDRLKTAFLANMSHEIRTPMNGILGFAELLKEPELGGEKQQKYIEIIERSGKRMLSIINDLVDLAKIESGLMSQVQSQININEQLEYIYTFFLPEVKTKGLKLVYKTSLAQNFAYLKTDKEKLIAVLINLVKNAIKFTDKGFIEFGYELEGEKDAAFLKFYVKDTGVGISRDRQQAVFERFVQADISNKMARDGAGLGLAISKSYIEMLGGKIWLESKENLGSTFFFTLPYQQESESNQSEFDNQQKDSGEINKTSVIKKLNILIAEDDKFSQILFDEIMAEFNHNLIKVFNGKEAVEIFRKNQRIDLIFMDIQMPELNGHEATRQIRKFNKDVIIIAQTAYAQISDKQLAIDSGCNDYITKPIKKDELLGLIDKYFG